MTDAEQMQWNKKLAEEIQDIAEQLKGTDEDKDAELSDLRAGCDLRRRADARAIAAWQSGTGRMLVWPDHADLCMWLMERLYEFDALKTLACDCIELDMDNIPGCRCCGMELGADGSGHRSDCLANAILRTTHVAFPMEGVHPSRKSPIKSSKKSES